MAKVYESQKYNYIFFLYSGFLLLVRLPLAAKRNPVQKNTVLFRYFVQNTLEKYIDPLLLPNEEPVEYFHP